MEFGLCAIVGCHNRPSKPSDLSFHRIPKDQELLKSWNRSIRSQKGRNILFPLRGNQICSDHFRPEDFFDDKSDCSLRKLRKFAVPSVFPELYRRENRKRHIVVNDDGYDENIVNGLDDGDNDSDYQSSALQHQAARDTRDMEWFEARIQQKNDDVVDNIEQVLKIQRPFKDIEVLLLVKEYLHLYETLQQLKELARIDMDLLYLCCDVKNAPEIKDDILKVQEIIRILMNGREVYNIEITNEIRSVHTQDAIGFDQQHTVSDRSADDTSKISNIEMENNAHSEDSDDEQNLSDINNGDTCKVDNPSQNWQFNENVAKRVAAFEETGETTCSEQEIASKIIDSIQQNPYNENLDLAKVTIGKGTGIENLPPFIQSVEGPSFSSLPENVSLKSDCVTLQDCKIHSFKDRLDLDKYFKSRNDNDPYVCEFCGQKCKSKNSLKKHLESYLENKFYICTLCGKEFEKRKGYSRHMRKHEIARNKCHKCPKCDKVFQLSHALTQHLELSHSFGNKSELCSVCGIKLKTHNGLMQHLKTHEEFDKFGPQTCTVCNKEFLTKKFLDQHMMSHTNENNFICDICGKGFKAKPYLQRHKKEMHILGHKHKPCHICGKNIGHSNLKRHLMIHSGKKPYKCPMCPMAFTQNFQRKLHIMTHTRQYPYECSVCHRRFKANFLLLQHLRRHDPSQRHNPCNEKYKCSLCNLQFVHSLSFAFHMLSKHSTELNHCLICNNGETFASQTDFESHLKNNHLTKMPFHCDICGESFYSQYKFYNHKMLHRDENALTCKECGKKYSSYICLRLHCQTKHTPEPKKFICDICGKHFNSKCNQLRHIKQHAGLKPHKCDICGGAFAQKSTLKSHMWTHSHEKRYPCIKCATGFNDKRNYLSHLKIMHPENVSNFSG